jgi:hypothetical protein
MPRQLDIDRLMSTRAAAHHGVVSRRMLLDAGVGKDTIDMRLRQRRLVGVYRGVYALGHAELRPEGQWLAAVESCRAGAALSHRSAAELWGIDDDARTFPIHVTVPTLGGVAHRRGLRVHRVPDLPDDEVVVHRAIRVTTVGRTILDLAGAIPGRRLEQVIRRASQLRRFDLVEQQALLDRHDHRPGAADLRRLLRTLRGVGTAATRSRLEIAFLQLCDDFAIPRPIVNGFVLGERVDFHWPGTTLVVETDGFEFHAMPTTFAGDRRRDQKLTLAGSTVIRLTWDQVTRERAATAHTISELLARCMSH